MTVRCPYCGDTAGLVGGDRIYPHRPDLHAKRFWLCSPCAAYVGCHPGTDKPLGRLADDELRRAKMAAHGMFDDLWKSGEMRRSEAYAWLANEMGIEPRDCHIGMMDVAQCRAVVQIVADRKKESRI